MLEYLKRFAKWLWNLCFTKSEKISEVRNDIPVKNNPYFNPHFASDTNSISDLSFSESESEFESYKEKMQKKHLQAQELKQEQLMQAQLILDQVDRKVQEISEQFKIKFDGKETLEHTQLGRTWRDGKTNYLANGFDEFSLEIPCEMQKIRSPKAIKIIDKINKLFNELKEFCSESGFVENYKKIEIETNLKGQSVMEEEIAKRAEMNARTGGMLDCLHS